MSLLEWGMTRNVHKTFCCKNSSLKSLQGPSMLSVYMNSVVTPTVIVQGFTDHQQRLTDTTTILKV